MGTYKNTIEAYGQQTLSTAAHHLRGLEWVNRQVEKFTGLTGPSARICRYRIGDALGDPGDFVTIAPTEISPASDEEDPKGYRPSTWKRALIAANRKQFENVMGEWRSRRMAIAYCLGERTMIGVNERTSEPLCVPVDRSGEFAENGELLAVNVGIGPQPNTIVLGAAAAHGRLIHTVDTFLLPVQEIPREVHQV